MISRQRAERDASLAGRASRRWRDVQPVVVRAAQTTIPTVWGTFQVIGYEEKVSHHVHLALVLGDVADGQPVLLRPHSECLTGDVFGSQRCDCQAQLHLAMRTVGEEGRGVILYLRQEGRGVGLINKLRAYALQDQGLDTVDANLHLGLPVDQRDYGIAYQILADLGINKLRVLSNNPRKYDGLTAYGVEVTEHLPLVTKPTVHNARYLSTKRERLGHLLDPMTRAPSDGVDGALPPVAGGADLG